MRRLVHSPLAMAAITVSLAALLTGCGEEKKAESKPAFANTKGKANTTPKTSKDEKPQPDRDGESDRRGRRRGFDFTERDTDGDGALSREEMGDMGWLMMGRADENGDGKLTEAEMQAFRESGNFRFPEPSEVVQVLDKDGDGQLAFDELPERMRDRYLDADIDGDGNISVEEMENRRAQREAERTLNGGGERGFGRGDRRPGGDRNPGGGGSGIPGVPEL